MLSCICGYIGQIFGGCMGNVARDARDEAQDLLVQSVNERVKPKCREFIENVIKWLFKFLKTAFRFIYGLSHEIQMVEKHLDTIENYLNSVKFDGGPEEREYKTNILYIRRCFRESIDSFHLLEQRRTRLYDEVAQASNTWGKIKKHLQLAVPHFKLLKQRYHIASTVIEMIEELLAVNDLPNHSITKPREPEDPRRLFAAQDKDLVGLDGPSSQLINLLDLDMKEHKGLHLVAVAGDGGVGKTTLVRKVYNQFKNRFQLCAWVTVSQSYDRADKLKDILVQFQKPEEIPDEWKDLGADEIKEKLNNFLSKNPEKRYIVVLDDVWDNNLIPFIYYALVPGEASSIAGRILITCREEGKIANQWAQEVGGNVFIHQPLSEDNAFRLLCKRLFNKYDCDDKDKGVVLREILRSCPLLPLIIRALAGVLCPQPNLQHWNTVRCHLWRDIRAGQEYKNAERILLYSYYDLPEEVKSCFLYFGMFPADHDIDVDQLFRIWIADGFIKSENKYTLEEVAQKHLHTLEDRGLVIISSDDSSPTLFHSMSPMKTFKRSAKVHDMFHEIIRDELQNDNFSQVVSDDNSSTISIDGKFERFSVYPTTGTFNVEFTPSNGRRCLGFRSIILNSSTALSLDHLLRLPHTATNSLRVLNIESNKDAIHEIPNEVGCLDNLRHLRLTKNTIGSNSLPEFIGNLQNLETLYIYSIPFACRLPQNMKRLSKLQHLIISPVFSVPLGVLENLTDLHTLTHMSITEPGVVQELRKLHQLRTLSVRHTRVANLPTFWEALMNMDKLRLLR